MAKQFTLGKKERLKSRKLIEELFREGKTFSVFPFRVSYTCRYLLPGEAAPLVAGSPGGLKFGAGAGTRNFKKAADRNRIKRVTKEAWRLQKRILQDALAQQKASMNVFLIYTAKELPDYKTVYSKVQVILDKLIKGIHESDTTVS